MSEIMKQSPEAGGTKLSISKQACHQIAGLATSILLATGLQGCGKSHAETPVDTDTSAPIIMADASGDPAYEKALNGTIDLDGNSSLAVVKVDAGGEATIQYAAVETTEIESKLGIDYLELTGDKQLAQMLSEGETEWMGNAEPMYEDYTGEAWKETVLEIKKYSSTNFRGDVANDIIQYIPLTVERFTDLDNEKYPGLILLTQLKKERDFGEKIGASQEG